ncbi:hypothetical protein, partial [Iodobacter sp.]|uniref:hypothetical protein n=1 Tax=Iodobacter sp. TaxID=1915058 RepID=UPI0025FBCAC3
SSIGFTSFHGITCSSCAYHKPEKCYLCPWTNVLPMSVNLTGVAFFAYFLGEAEIKDFAGRPHQNQRAEGT